MLSSWLRGRAKRAAQALGYTRVLNYTLLREPGDSVRSLFAETGLTKGGEWDCFSRPRKKAEQAEPKRRWVSESPPFEKRG